MLNRYAAFLLSLVSSAKPCLNASTALSKFWRLYWFSPSLYQSSAVLGSAHASAGMSMTARQIVRIVFSQQAAAASSHHGRIRSSRSGACAPLPFPELSPTQQPLESRVHPARSGVRHFAAGVAVLFFTSS